MGAIMTWRSPLVRIESLAGAFSTIGGTPTVVAETGGGLPAKTELAAVPGNGGEEHSMAAERPNAEQWSRVKKRVRTELGEDVFTSWFARLEFEDADKGTVFLSVPTRFLKSWILNHYNDKLLALWKTESEAVIRVEILVRGTVRSKSQPLLEKASEVPPPAMVMPMPAPTSAKRFPEPEGSLGGS